ncbi:MAG: DUF998 domain-containing protein [Promethearchaeota archaeon]|nr:MAG: DUF998 domain-containing protein [Candidatus Lokiarchaeota archaeon]
MLSKEALTDSVVSLNQLFPNSINQFIKPFEKVVNPDIHNGMCLDFEICDRKEKKKVNPILCLAKPEDAEELVGIYKELYNGTYPYKEMEDINEVRRMIQDPNIQWIIYQDPSHQIAGCITFVLDFGNKRGYIRGFMLKKKYQGYIDITKAMIGSMIGMIHKYKDKIYIWYVENRTAHSKSQYSMWVCGIAPIGFYPNKDVFLGKVESDLMQICYDERALKQFRVNKIPEIIPEVEICYLYSENRYDLGDYRITTPGLNLDLKKIYRLKKDIKKQVKKDKFGYETIQFSFSNSDSFFEFIYTPQVQNFEKTKYQVKNLEELYVFAKNFINCGKELGIRYCEAFISAYEPSHQKLFYDLGLTPRGYVPSWVFNSEKEVFEDHILFNWYNGKIDPNIQLIDEGKILLDIVSLDNAKHIKDIVDEKQFFEKFPALYSIKERLSNVWDYPKTIKSSLMMGLMIYLFMLVGSIITAHIFGYNIISHTISQLGSFTITPLPFIFDFSCIVGGLTTTLLYCYISKRMQAKVKNKLLKRILRFGLIFGSIGSIGIMLVGIFSLDRSGPEGMLHIISSICAFGGFIIALPIFGVAIFHNNLKMPKIIGINGILPFIILVVNFIVPSPLLEWILLITILTSLIPWFCWASFS